MKPSPDSLRSLADRIEADLRGNILPFWIRHVALPGPRAFIGGLSNDLRVDPAAERGCLLTTRILWTYAAAYRRYAEPAHLDMAHLAYEDLMTRFHDPVHGGFYWSIAADGSVGRDRKQVYGQAFAVYALTEYHAASGRREPLDTAIATQRLIEERSRDAHHGGYLEAFDRTWAPIADMRLSEVDLNEPKSQNTHLHILEAYTNLLLIRPDDALRRTQAGLVDLMLSRILKPATGHLGLFFALDWTLRSDRISYGHDIEAAWLLTEAAEVVGDPALLARVRAAALTIADATLAEGIDTDGAIFNEGGPAGLTDTNKEWWPQAEAVVGFLNAYQIRPDARYLDAARRAWEFIEARLIDRRHGEWFRGVTRDGTVIPSHLKVGFWKCPYHNGRTGLEAVRRLRAIAAAP